MIFLYLNEEESSVVGLLLCLLGSAEVSLGGEELREEIIKEIWRDGWSVGVLPTPPVPLSVALWHCYCCSANVGKRDKLDLCPRSWYRFEITPNGFWSKTALGMPEFGHKMTRRRQQQPEMLRFSRVKILQSSVCLSHSFRISRLLPWQCSAGGMPVPEVVDRERHEHPGGSGLEGERKEDSGREEEER